MRMRRKKNRVPRMERCAQWLISDPQALRGNWRSLLPGAKELRIELGCGKGRFTCQTAAAAPEVLFVAVERVPDAMVMAMERARDMELHNVFFIDADAANLPAFFAPDEVDLIYINFCDPWRQRKKWAKRRLTHRNFLNLYEVLFGEKGGEVFMKTDNQPLFDFSLNEIADKGWRLHNISLDLHNSDYEGNVMTEYEKKFSEMGQPIFRLEGYFNKLPDDLEKKDE